jgi:hypothetical protein
MEGDGVLEAKSRTHIVVGCYIKRHIHFNRDISYERIVCESIYHDFSYFIVKLVEKKAMELLYNLTPLHLRLSNEIPVVS